MGALNEALDVIDGAAIAFENMAIDFTLGAKHIAINWEKVADEQRLALREAHEELKAYIDGIAPNIEATVRNAVKPSYNIHTECPECGEDITCDNGEWLLWCGNEAHAQTLIDSTKHLLKGIKDGNA